VDSGVPVGCFTGDIVCCPKRISGSFCDRQMLFLEGRDAWRFLAEPRVEELNFVLTEYFARWVNSGGKPTDR